MDRSEEKRRECYKKKRGYLRVGMKRRMKKGGISHKTCTRLVILEGHALKLVNRNKN